MGAIFPITLIFVILIIVIAAIRYSIKMEKKRTEDFGLFAEELGLPFNADGEANLAGTVSRFKVFNVGRGRKFKNAIVGETEELKLAIFDYQYTTGSGKHSQTFNQTIASLESPLLNLPAFMLQPEHFFHKVGAFFGSGDINFDTHQDFSNAFFLKGDDEEAIRNLFHVGLLEFFENQKHTTMEGSGDRVIYFRSGKRVKPMELREFLEQGYQIFALLTQNGRD